MPAKILIVDDDPDMVELLRFALTEAGYSACTAATGTEALAEAQTVFARSGGSGFAAAGNEWF